MPSASPSKLRLSLSGWKPPLAAHTFHDVIFAVPGFEPELTIAAAGVSGKVEKKPGELVDNHQYAARSRLQQHGNLLDGIVGNLQPNVAAEATRKPLADLREKVLRLNLLLTPDELAAAREVASPFIRWRSSLRDDPDAPAPDGAEK
jgi:hypothetical protein